MIDPMKTHTQRLIPVRAIDDGKTTARAIAEYLAHSITPCADRSATMEVDGRRVVVVRNGAGRVLAVYGIDRDGAMRALARGEAWRVCEAIGEPYEPPRVRL